MGRRTGRPRSAAPSMPDRAAPATIIRLVLADDHPIVLDGLALLFASEGDFEVVARATNGDEALQAVRELQPDILVLDLRMPGKDGLVVLREMQREASATKTVVLTALENDDVLDAISLGAGGIVLKDMAVALLVQCVREVHAGRKWIERSIAGRALGRCRRRFGLRVRGRGQGAGRDCRDGHRAGYRRGRGAHRGRL